MAEKAFLEEFLPDIFHRAAEHMLDWTIMVFLVRHVELAIPYHTHT